MKTARFKAHNRKSLGSITIEFVLLLPLFVVLAVVGVNCYLMLFTCWMNDSACRDACRAAAQQSNEEDAKLAAAAACKRFTCGSFGQPNVSLKSGDFVYETFPKPDGTPDLSKGPYVKITTAVSGKLPFEVWFNGAFFGGDMNFSRSYSYPLVNNSGSDDGNDDGGGGQIPIPEEEDPDQSEPD